MDLGSKSSKHSFWKINPVDISGHRDLLCGSICCDLEFFSPSTNWWSGVSCACFAAVAQHGTPPNPQLNSRKISTCLEYMFEVSGCHICTFRPATQTRTRPSRQTHSTSRMGIPPSRLWEDAPCTLNIFRGRNATQLVGGNFCLRGTARSAETRDVFTNVYLWPPWRSKPCLWESLGPVCSTAHGKAFRRFSEKKKALRPCNCRMLHTSM